MNSDPKGIEARARQLFDDSVEHIDGPARSRLTQARYAALAELDRAQARLGTWLPAGALAAAAILAVALWTGPGSGVQPPPVLAAAPADDFELLATGEDLEMLGEDAEFYTWAASAEAGNGIG